MFTNLPIELEHHIYEFCIDKRIHWNNVSEQFLKGGYNRKNLHPERFIKHQHKLCRRLWMSTRPELNGGMSEWNNITKKREPCIFKYKGEWCHKKKLAVVTFTTKYGFINQSSSKNPVSKWISNINKFETSNPKLAKKLYLSEKNRDLNIKNNSKFYVKKRAKNYKKKIKEQEKIQANLFIKERQDLKKTIVLSKFEYYHNQKLILSFTESDSLKFYRGTIQRIYLETQRDIHGRCIFTKPRGIRRFDPNIVDNYIGEIRIKVSFEDNEYRYYNPDRLLERIEQSKIDLINENKKNFVRWYDYIILKKYDLILREKVVINDTDYFVSTSFECGVNNIVLFDTSGILFGIYDKITKNIAKANIG